jgi:AcrR family transcriptional regulator
MGTGLQERRLARTRSDIQRAAFELFEQHGFDTVTIDQIAERAGVSPRTYFRYFEAKSDLIFGVITGPLERVAEALEGCPPHEPIGRAFPRALHGALDAMDDTTVVALHRASAILRSAESLRALSTSAMPARERRLEAALQSRLSASEQTISARFLATSLNIALWMAMDMDADPSTTAPSNQLRNGELAERVLEMLGSWSAVLSGSALNQLP